MLSLACDVLVQGANTSVENYNYIILAPLD
jgi:hypothetical protein